jgi:hypothetical protein
VVVVRSSVAVGSPDKVIGGGMVAAEADDPRCEHEASMRANAGRMSGKVWDTARRFISTEIYSME